MVMSKCFDLLKGIGVVLLVAMIGATVWGITTGAMTQKWIITEVLVVAFFFAVSFVISDCELKEQDDKRHRYADR